MAHFLEHMVFKGSERLEAGAFDLAIEALGGSSNAATGFDDVHFHVLIPPETSQQALDLLLDLVLHPALEQESFRLEREVVLEEMAQYADQPDELVLQQLLKQGCPDHPYGRPILGERSSLLAMRLMPSERCCSSSREPVSGIRAEKSPSSKRRTAANNPVIGCSMCRRYIATNNSEVTPNNAIAASADQNSS